ncbi:synaptophysin-like isoform X2 [Patagioenas fasciata]|uniref:synaptophysin-like isoform X2 n=1 Tax=Patagioenas fasciata TaxID=372321 RepID=UPI003A995608
MAPAPRRDVTSALPSLPPPSLCGPSRSAHAALFPLPPPPPPPRCSAPRRPPPPPRCVCPSRRMEVLNQLVAGGQFRVIKEPLGFLKLLEWLFSIFAFATCGGYSGSLRLSLECPPPNRTHGPPLTVSFGYPFRLHQVYFEAPSCGGGPPERVFLVGDYSSAAQFFVVVGVGAFLYAPAALGGYLFLGGGYRPGGRLPRVDLGVTVALAFLWLVASCAWAAALGDVKAATAPGGVLAQVSGCQRPGGPRCRALGGPHVAGLNTSVIFGFLNLVLWTGNVWFVFKETGWGGLGPRAPPPGGPPEKAPEAGLGGGLGPTEPGFGPPGGGVPAPVRPGGAGGGPRCGVRPGGPHGLQQPDVGSSGPTGGAALRNRRGGGAWGPGGGA